MKDRSAGGWEIHRLVGEAGELHARALPQPATRQLWLCGVTRAALVLGSSARQLDFVDQELARRWGVDVVRRRSGGAAVLLEPGAQLWVDVLIGREDPLWHHDVGRAAWWVGAWWQRSLVRLGISTTVHQGPLQGGERARRICFAGIGPGEVLAGGRKLVGLSQRRTRDVARFQTVMLVQWQPQRLAQLCGVGHGAAVQTAVQSPAGYEGASLDRVAVGLEELLAVRVEGLPGDAVRIGDDGGASPGSLDELEAALIEELPGL